VQIYMYILKLIKRFFLTNKPKLQYIKEDISNLKQEEIIEITEFLISKYKSQYKTKLLSNSYIDKINSTNKKLTDLENNNLLPNQLQEQKRSIDSRDQELKQKFIE
jgi:hypothetical protein